MADVEPAAPELTSSTSPRRCAPDRHRGRIAAAAPMSPDASVSHGKTVDVCRASLRMVALAGIVLGAVTWAAPPAEATHAYRCDVTGDPTLNRAWRVSHRVWDGVSGGHPDRATCALQDTLGVDHVKDCDGSSP